MSRILFIDDGPSNVAEYKEVLEEAGWDVQFLSGIEQWIEWSGRQRRESIDLVILDVMMPWLPAFTESETDTGLLTGLSLYVQVRRKLGDRVPVLFLTANPDDKIRAKARLDRLAQVVPKSVLPMELSEIVNTWFDQLSRARE